MRHITHGWIMSHCNTQHTATHCNTLQHMSHTLDWCCVPSATGKRQHMNELPHICSTREWVMSHICWTREWVMSHIHGHIIGLAATHEWMNPHWSCHTDATHCNTLQHTATHCNTLQHTATHCNTLQHTDEVMPHITYMIAFIHRASGNIWMIEERRMATYKWRNPVT